MSTSPEIRVLKTSQDLFEAAAKEFMAQASEAVRVRGRFTVALSGGSTRRRLYSLLAAMPSLPWDKDLFFLGRRAPRSSRSRRQQLPHGERSAAVEG